MGTTLPTQRKTTTAINLSSGLAMRGYKTLLIDMDPQHHSTILTSVNGHDYYIGEALLKHSGHIRPILDIVCNTKRKNLDIVPSDERLSTDEDLLNKEIFSEQRLAKAINGLNYDFIIVDSPPNIDHLTINVIFACDILLVPLKAGRLSIEGFRKMVDTIENIKGGMSHKDIKLFFTLFKKSSSIVNDWSEGDLEDYKKFLMKTSIRDYTAHEQAQIAKESIFEFDPKSKAAEDYNSFIEEFLQICQNRI